MNLQIQKVLGMTALFIGAAACTTMTHRGVVAMKLENNEAHVGMGTNELSVGDHVDLFHNQCTNPGGKNAAIRSCVKKEGGHGIVTRLIDKDYSVVKFESGVEFSEGDMIEKHAH